MLILFGIIAGGIGLGVIAILFAAAADMIKDLWRY
jgi:hypothetical protein